MKIGIFGKVFLYTLAFLVITISVTAVLFAGQFKAFYDYSQRTIINSAFSPLVKQIEGKSAAEIKEIVNDFHKENPQFEFVYTTPTENILYKTDFGDGADSFEKMENSRSDRITVSIVNQRETGDAAIAQYRVFLTAQNETITLKALGIVEDNGYRDTIKKLIIGLVVLIFAGMIGAALFAREMTSPIKRLACETRKMSELLPVVRPPCRHDELGQLERDVHNMYDKLRITINELESEIEREKEMEENQRYFFSAASHELKTPIAAIAALLEGMLANVGEYKNHSKYLRECIKMTRSQNKIISEILEIVNLSGGGIKVNMEAVALNELLGRMLTEHRTLAQNKGLELKISIPEGAVCLADSNMLSRAVSNVVLNAVQNTPNGGVVKIQSEKAGGKTRLSVINTGTCIDDSAVERMFEPFYRADKSRSRSQERSGLGLSIVKKMLDRMEVPFAIENIESEGETCVLFYMELETPTCD